MLCVTLLLKFGLVEKTSYHQNKAFNDIHDFIQRHKLRVLMVRPE